MNTFEKAQAMRHHMREIVWDMYSTEGMRVDAIMSALGIKLSYCHDLLREKRHHLKAEEKLANRSSKTFKKTNKAATVRRGLVTPIQEAYEAPLQERGRFLQDQEGKEALARVQEPYKPSEPEFMLSHMPKTHRQLLLEGAA